MPNPHALYRFYDETGQLLYVGISVNPGARFAQHRSDKPWWGEAVDIKVQPMPSRQAALAAERDAIKNERPRHNVAHSETAREATGQELDIVYATHLLMRQFPIEIVDNYWRETVAELGGADPLSVEVAYATALKVANWAGRRYMDDMAPDVVSGLLEGPAEINWARTASDLKNILREAESQAGEAHVS